MKANMTQSLKPHVSHEYISVHSSLTTMWYYNDTSCTVLPDRLFSQLIHTATHFCLHFPVVTITSQIADWADGENDISTYTNAIFVSRIWLSMLVSWWCIAARWVTDMEEEPVNHLQYLLDAVKILAFVFSCLSRVPKYFELMSFSPLGFDPGVHGLLILIRNWI